MPPLDVTLFTEPACPFASSAEPAWIRLRRHYAASCSRIPLATAEPRDGAATLRAGAREDLARAGAYWSA